MRVPIWDIAFSSRTSQAKSGESSVGTESNLCPVRSVFSSISPLGYYACYPRPLFVLTLTPEATVLLLLAL